MIPLSEVDDQEEMLTHGDQALEGMRLSAAKQDVVLV